MTQSPNLQCYQAFALFASRNFPSGADCSNSKHNATLITTATWMMITKKALEVEPKKGQLSSRGPASYIR